MRGISMFSSSLFGHVISLNHCRTPTMCYVGHQPRDDTPLLSFSSRERLRHPGKALEGGGPVRRGWQGPRGFGSARALFRAAPRRARPAAPAGCQRAWSPGCSARPGADLWAAGERGSGAVALDGEPGGGRRPGTADVPLLARYEGCRFSGGSFLRGSAAKQCDRARSFARPRCAAVLVPRSWSPQFHFSGKRRQVMTSKLC